MRRHAPMWEAELGDGDGNNGIDVYLRKSLNDLEETPRVKAHNASWPRLLTFLSAAVVFMIIALAWKPGV